MKTLFGICLFCLFLTSCSKQDPLEAKSGEYTNNSITIKYKESEERNASITASETFTLKVTEKMIHLSAPNNRSLIVKDEYFIPRKRLISISITKYTNSST